MPTKKREKKKCLHAVFYICLIDPLIIVTCNVTYKEIFMYCYFETKKK